MEQVRLRDVSKRYAGRRVLAGVDVAAGAGELLALTGGNGSGKSTVLRLMAGLARPSAGTVHRTARVVGYVPDVFATHDRMTASAYLRRLGHIRGLGPVAAHRRADELLQQLALTGGSGTAMRRLSKGNAQKVALAQALLVPPELLILDEPWSGLDASAHATLGELLVEAAGAGAAVVFTEHSARTVETLATRTCQLRDGRLTSLADPARRLTELRLLTGTPMDWSLDPQVLEVRHDPERPDEVIVIVPTGHHDAVLLATLTHGWSVVAVRELGAS